MTIIYIILLLLLLLLLYVLLCNADVPSDIIEKDLVTHDVTLEALKC